MGEITKISWAHSTFNPWIGCTKISPGCDNCYAAARDVRFTKGAHWGAGAPRRRTTPGYWRQPIYWNKEAAKSGLQRRVFCASQADVFDNEVPQEWREDLFKLIRETPHLTWLLLTKRIGNVREMLPADWGDGYPNVWLGITVVTQDEAERDIPKLRDVKACVRWLSIEPQIEEINLEYPESLWPKGPPICCDGSMCACRGMPVEPPFVWGIDWVVCGGESAQFGKCRPFELDWARNLRGTCKFANVKFFMKQIGTSTTNRGLQFPHMGKGEDWDCWPAELRVREFPA